MATKRAKPAGTQEVKALPVTHTASSNGNGDKGNGRRVMGERNWLAKEIDRVIRRAGGPVTVREITAQIENSYGEHPSSGAVAAALVRWAEAGYIRTNPKPLGFKSFAAKYADSSLDAFLEKQKELKAKQRKANRVGANA